MFGKSKNWNKRYSDYKRLYCKRQPKLYNSFLSHAFNAHTFEILEQNVLPELLAMKECEWIQGLNSYHNGLNCTIGGEANPMDNPETRKKVSLALKGKKRKTFTEEHRKNISLGAKGRKMPPRTKATLKKMSIAQKGKPWSEARRKAQVEEIK